MKKNKKYKIWLVVISIAILLILVISSILSNYIPGIKSESKKVYCPKESKGIVVCTEIYMPVCGWFDSKKIQCIKYPCAQKFSNSCFACGEENVKYYTEGECPV